MKRDFVAKALLKWHAKHGRHDLPWQRPRTPYRVWVSEIMLQQTQVATVIPYFARFMDSFPDVVTLAKAPLDKVLHHWAGLGYYARARNLHKAAQILVKDFKSMFPQEVQMLATLPGIGLSTAGAIVSQAFNSRAPILDGNVKRVLSRFHGIQDFPGEKKIHDKLWKLADFYTPIENAANYTQAIMDLGATCCTRSKPTCEQCPLTKHCVAFQENTQSLCPGKKPRKRLPLKQLFMLCAKNKRGEFLLEQRPSKGIWAGLWSLPEFSDEETLKPWLQKHVGPHHSLECLPTILHTFTHYHLHIEPRLLALDTSPRLKGTDTKMAWLSKKALSEKALPAPIQKLLETIRS
ncbi:MAG: A/G-specific adenine glycosylase [Candidatus Berkiella sp.]